MLVEIYSDVVCPWCYIGERRFERALGAYGGAADVEVVYRAYQLDREAPTSPVPLKDYLRARYGANAGAMLARVSSVASGEGIEIDWDRVRAVNTLTAHRLLGLAGREYGSTIQRELMKRLFELYFTRGGDISDADSLVETATSVGMAAERVRAFMSSDEGMPEVEDEIAAAGALGIGAVPTFVFDGRYAVQGAQQVSTFVRALEEVAGRSDAESREDPEPAGCEEEACGAG